MAVNALFVVAVAMVDSNTIAVACLCGSMFCGTVATTCAWATVSVVAPANCTGSLGAMQNFGGYLGGALAPTVTGFIVQVTGSFVPALLVGAAMCVFAAVASSPSASRSNRRTCCRAASRRQPDVHRLRHHAARPSVPTIHRRTQAYPSQATRAETVKTETRCETRMAPEVTPASRP